MRGSRAVIGLSVALCVVAVASASPIIIVDNADGSPGFTTDQPWDGGVSRSDWWEGSGLISRYVTGVSTATFTPELPLAGLYDVFMWCPGERSSVWRADAPVRVNYDGGTDALVVAQDQYGGDWYLLGQYPFAAGTAGNVQIDGEDISTNWSVADAVMFEYVPEPASLCLFALGVPMLLRGRRPSVGG
jgi:hypothetical protein